MGDPSGIEGSNTGVAENGQRIVFICGRRYPSDVARCTHGLDKSADSQSCPDIYTSLDFYIERVPRLFCQGTP